jgi:hypothetical protein
MRKLDLQRTFAGAGAPAPEDGTDLLPPSG